MKTLLPALCLISSAGVAAVIESDVCIYGGTSGGVTAAVQAARMGKLIVIAEPGRHLGGMTSGGLSAVDIGDPRSVGGIAREYFTKLAATVGVTLAWDKAFKGDGGGGPATGGAYAIEPHKAEQVFTDMAKEAGVKVHFGARLASVKKDGAAHHRTRHGKRRCVSREGLHRHQLRGRSHGEGGRELHA
jgi:flavin-dependent dehydrogenase